MKQSKWPGLTLITANTTIALVTASIWLLLTYLLLALVMGDRYLGITWSTRFIALALLVSFGAIYVVLSWLKQKERVSVNRLKETGLFSIIVLCSILGVDLAYGVFSNTRIETVQDIEAERGQDPQEWHGEIYPRIYSPTNRNFWLHKPNVTVNATLYGQFYYPELLRSPTLVNSVLESRPQTFIIDQHGFRNTTSMEDARVFALGDSYVLGENVSQDDVWVKDLEKQTGQPVYNLGVSFTSPKQQLMMLQYLFKTQGDLLHIDHLIWMIFEGNDLEETYKTYISRDSKSAFDGTMLDALASIPKTIRSSSILYKWKSGGLKSPVAYGSSSNVSSPYLVDGVSLGDPLYHSSKLGYKMFRHEYLKRATEPESYVLNHPNLPRLEQTFADMQALSKEHNFKVTVVIAPSASRLYAPYFDGFPQISKEPYFINYVQDLSGRMDFDVLNLYPLMGPYAEKELLYARDDSHWNERGNQVAAGLISKHLFGK